MPARNSLVPSGPVTSSQIGPPSGSNRDAERQEPAALALEFDDLADSSNRLIGGRETNTIPVREVCPFLSATKETAKEILTTSLQSSGTQRAGDR
jgi:hypothetical protein